MRLLSLTLIFSALTFLNACKEIKIENGEIPDQYLAQAQQLVGDYAGEFARRKGVLQLRLDENVAKAHFSSSLGDDLLGEECNSRIGFLKRVTVSGDGDEAKLKNATFAFDPNHCKDEVWGEELSLDFKKESDKIKIYASVFHYATWELDCYYTYDPIQGTRQVCSEDYVHHYLRGKFVRKLTNYENFSEPSLERVD